MVGLPSLSCGRLGPLLVDQVKCLLHFIYRPRVKIVTVPQAKGIEWKSKCSLASAQMSFIGPDSENVGACRPGVESQVGNDSYRLQLYV